MEIKVRQGNRADCEALLSLIRELAHYEKAPQEVTLTLEQLERDGFEGIPAYRFFVAELSGEVIGIALYYPKYSTWKGSCIFLEDLIVTEEYRRSGAGKLLFDAVATVAAREGAARLEWQVLEWNTPAIRFYEKLGASLDPEWINGKLTAQQLKRYL